MSIFVLLSVSFVAYFILQANNEQKVRSTIIEQQEQTQVQYARSVSQHLSADLGSLMHQLQTLSAYPAIQNGDFTGAEADKLLRQTYNETLQTANVDGVFLVDRNSKIVNYVSNSIKKPDDIGYDLSHWPAYGEYLSNGRLPTFSGAYVLPEDGRLRVALIYPVYNEDTGEYLGAIRQPLVLHDFLSGYGNLDDINSQYIVVLDKNATIMSAPMKAFVGLNFFDSQNQNQISDPSVNSHFKTVLSGNEHTAVLGTPRNGDRLNTGEPVLVNGKARYFVFVVTPTAAIYAKIDSVIATQRTEFYLLQGGIAAAIATSAYFLFRWNRTLEKAVDERTADLKSANEQLKRHDRLQNEFVNIAAHELRTPIQPILSVAELLDVSEVKEGEVKVNVSDLKIIVRNAERLERLAADILDVTRIENSSFKLSKERFDLNELLRVLVEEANRKTGKDIEIIYTIEKDRNQEGFDITADKQRITQVISNLLSNAIHYTEPEEKITVNLIAKGSEPLKITVSDMGTGIDKEILPRLFTKFSSTAKAGSGTGLGLYISKSIVESHGGRIWGENNQNGKGATFGFTIPIKSEQQTIEAGTIARARLEPYSDDPVYALAKDAFEHPN